MANSEIKTSILRGDYQPPSYWISQVDLDVDIQARETLVTATLDVKHNSATGVEAPLILQGRGQELLAVMVDGSEIPASDYKLTDTELHLPFHPKPFQLTLRTRIDPDSNTSLEGFYRSGDILCTQCEAHGFSRISYFPDRPDVLAKYRVSITADKKQYPVLLANGNLLASEQLAEGRHKVIWEDPHPKPCYLFAMVAGDLACVEDSYTTTSGREVAIRFYVEYGDEARCDQAVYSLKAAMAWDEATYGLEYDLDLYMVVAVGSFNMGAMENKGLNVFNSKYVLASTESATDTDLELIQAVIGHEYFHNWTGNRVTCRDWFQLSLKEGLTVFREQQFMEDSLASSTQRIEHVRLLRSQQFAEDSSPTAHPVRPESYIEVNNFYTLTIYEKGSEIIRMIRGFIGQEAFRAGLRLYLSRHDGSAATIDEFISAMSEASEMDLNIFQAWYCQAGTPQLKVREEYDAKTLEYNLHFEQDTPDTAGQTGKSAVPIPMQLSLLNSSGEQISTESLLIDSKQQSHHFSGLKERPLPVFLRDFSAPVKLEYLYSRDELLLIARAESDGFCRWDAMQRMFNDLIDSQVNEGKTDLGALTMLCTEFLTSADNDYGLTAELIRMPAEVLLAENYEPVPVEALVLARDAIEHELAERMQQALLSCYKKLNTGKSYQFSALQVGQRRLKNLCLQYLTLTGDEGRLLAYAQYKAADNMTDRLAALEALNHADCAERQQAMQHFAEEWKEDALVMDKWLVLQATSRLPNALDRVRGIHQSERFDAGNPNRIRSLVGSFCMNNMRAFHSNDGKAYEWLADEVLRLDSLNPQVASRLCVPLCRWRRQESLRGELMQQALRRISTMDKLSADVYEQVTKALL